MATKLNWYKGNTHTHSTRSDGDTSPGMAACWYRDSGYDFLVISDHNLLVTTEEIQDEMSQQKAEAPPRPFLLIAGEEISDGFQAGQIGLPLHIGAIGTTRTIGIQGGASVADTVQRAIDAIQAQGGIAHINHPNFFWAITAKDLLALQNLTHLEVYNGHPDVNNWGGGGSPSVEAMWDELLSKDRRVYAMATDDAHHFKVIRRTLASPGRGWIVVRAPRLEPDAILSAIRNGEFYASTGVEIDDIGTTRSTLGLKLKQQRTFRYTTSFIGHGGKVLKQDTSMTPSYTLKPGDVYVRARVASSAGDYAWTQPLYRP